MDKLKDLAGKLGNKGQGNSSADPSQPAAGPTGTAGNNPAGTGDPAAAGGAGASGKGDFLDQGVGMAGKQFGHNLDRQQEEKISDGIRTGAGKAGFNIPIKDQN